jgi:hypothetical protein
MSDPEPPRNQNPKRNSSKAFEAAFFMDVIQLAVIDAPRAAASVSQPADLLPLRDQPVGR